uniref:FYVE-type domain-containing protein n=1 Tax=Globisporangium ultimum (strain ATCC 200006 / CBS 805.95 / DAOM BR144) TaxID=431595 RepID=K3WXH1_GLOUD
MKFPLRKTVFPKVALTREQCTEFEQLAQCVLDEALDKYEGYQNLPRRQLPSSQWKAIKSRENVTVYQERCTRAAGSSSLPSSTTAKSAASALTSQANGLPVSAQVEVSASSSSSASASYSGTTSATATAGVSDASERLLPKLVGLGTVAGTIEDMVYGMASPIAGHAMIKSAYTKDEVIDTEVLYEFQGPTPEHPLRFVGLKWLVKGHTNGLGALVRPRDFVYLENSGVLTTTGGSRIGYVLMHSVDLPECRELEEFSIVRGKFSLFFLFRQLAKGTVDVFMKSFVDLSGNLGDTIAIKTSIKSLISFPRSVICAQNKKIAWTIFKKRHHLLDAQGTNGNKVASISNGRSVNSSLCTVCAKSFSKLSTISACQICDVLLCSTCRDERKLTILASTSSLSSRAMPPPSRRSAKEVVQEVVILCRSCIARYSHANAAEVAREEILNGLYGSIPQVPVALPAYPVSAASPPASSSSAPPSGNVSVIKAELIPISEEIIMVSAPTMKAVKLVDVGTSLVTHESPEAGDNRHSDDQEGGTVKTMSTRGPRTISVDTVTSSDMSAEDLSDLVDLLASDPTANGSTRAPSRTKTLEVEVGDNENGDEGVIELAREDGEWTHSSHDSEFALPPPPPPVSSQAGYNERELYQRITELNQAAENVYQFTKRTTATVLLNSSTPTSLLPPPLSLPLSRVTLEEELD